MKANPHSWILSLFVFLTSGKDLLPKKIFRALNDRTTIAEELNMLQSLTTYQEKAAVLENLEILYARKR